MKSVITALLLGFIISSDLQAQWIPDTLIYNTTFDDTFNLKPREVAVYVFQMPADGEIQGFNVPIAAIDGDSSQIWVELWSLTYPFDSIGSLYDSSHVDSIGWLGYYPSQTNDTIPDYEPLWLQNWNAFGDSGLCAGAELIPNSQDPLYHKLWYGDWAPISIETTGDHWMNLSYMGDIEAQQGEYFGIFLYHYKINRTYEDTTPLVLFHSNNVTDINNPYPVLVFSPSCRGISGEGGWHIRSVVLNCELAVRFPGNKPPLIYSINNLPTTLSTESRTVSAQIIHGDASGGGVGVVSATIHYQIDSLSALVRDVPMELVSGDNNNGIWEGAIPGQSPGTIVFWYLTATEVSGSPTSSSSFSYFIFEPTIGNDLIYNNQDPLYGIIGYASYLYFYWGGVPFDIWDASYGGIVNELTEHYTTIVELAGTGPYYDNDVEIAAWWGGDKTYIVSSDEWLGTRSGWTDGPTADGSVAKSILGIAYEYNDINYVESGDQFGISRLMADPDGAASALAGFLADSLFLNYDPAYETGGSNWLDGVDPVDGYSVDMTGYSLVLDSADQVAPPTDSEVYNVMIHGHAGNGGKSAFLAFDAMALNTVPTYHWVGASWFKVNISSSPDTLMPEDASPLIAVYELLNGILSVDDNIAGTLNAFSLKGNYPNPFNPVTNIHYELHNNTQVKITIYDVLGRKVKSLLNAQQTAGEKTIQWDSRNDLGLLVSAGVYFYKVEAHQKDGGQAGSFVQTKKMVLLK